MFNKKLKKRIEELEKEIAIVNEAFESKLDSLSQIGFYYGKKYLWESGKFRRDWIAFSPKNIISYHKGEYKIDYAWIKEEDIVFCNPNYITGDIRKKQLKIEKRCAKKK